MRSRKEQRAGDNMWWYLHIGISFASGPSARLAQGIRLSYNLFHNFFTFFLSRECLFRFKCCSLWSESSARLTEHQTRKRVVKNSEISWRDPLIIITTTNEVLTWFCHFDLRRVAIVAWKFTRKSVVGGNQSFLLRFGYLSWSRWPNRSD